MHVNKFSWYRFLSWCLVICILQPASVVSLNPDAIEHFVLDVQALYFTARSAIEDSTSTPERLTGLWTKLEAAVMNLRKIQWHLITTKPCAEDILAPLVQSLSTIEIRIGKVIEQYSCLVPFLREQLCYRAPVTSTEWVGRPSYVITKEQLEVMRSYGLSWVEIAKALGVSISTIWRRRIYHEMERRKHYGRRKLGMQELIDIVAEIKSRSVNAGIIMIEGELAARSLYARRSAIAEALVRHDPIGAGLRWRNLTPRVTYSVPGPNSLWHLDGNHKLIRWRLVVHGGIDGYSRLVVFLRCSSNNRAATVANLFLGATTEFCWPSRVRTDKGGENAEVARLMVEKRGEGRGSILQGSSVHNQRIERLWRDMRKMVTEFFRLLFYFLERNNLLNPNDELDLAALHYVFIPRINENLEKFKVSWNNHKLSTEKQKTPNQLYILGMLNLFGSEYTAVKDFFESNVIDSNYYGVEEPDVIDAASEVEGAVVVPETMQNLSNASLQELQLQVNPLERDTNHGISLYIRGKEFLSQQN